MAEWELSVDVAVPPEQAWELVGDPVGVPRWFPKYVSASLDGAMRTLVRDDGGELVEELLERDDARRYYAYTVVSGAPVASHRASFEVQAVGDGSRIVWWTRTEPQDPAVDMESRLRPGQEAGLERMKAVLEGTLTSE